MLLLLLEPVAVKLFVSVVLLPYKCSPLKDKKMCDLCLCRDPETDWKGKNQTVVSIDQLGVHVRVLSACRQILTAEYLLGEEGCPQDLKHAAKLYLKAGQLGCAESYYNIGGFTSKGSLLKRICKTRSIILVLLQLLVGTLKQDKNSVRLS